jgi:hypothetical protein
MTFHACNSSEPYSRLILSAMSSSGREPPVALLRRYRAHPSTMSCCHLLLVQDTTLGDANDCMAMIIVNREVLTTWVVFTILWLLPWLPPPRTPRGKLNQPYMNLLFLYFTGPQDKSQAKPKRRWSHLMFSSSCCYPASHHNVWYNPSNTHFPQIKIGRVTTI